MSGLVEIPTFIKWAGGKTALLKQFDEFLPDKIERYMEPFLGSGAMFFFVKQEYGPKKCLLSDINGDLINCFAVVRDRAKELTPLLEKHRNNHSQEYYYKTRKSNGTLSDVERAAKFIYLNKTCFNGLYRVNSKGQFNVPIGSYRRPKIYNEDSLVKASGLLAGAKLTAMPFEDVLNFAKAGDFVYLDPPYFPLSKTSSFTSYTKTAFGEKEQRGLCAVFRKLDKLGCKVMLSNSAHTFIKKLYKDFRIETVSANRLISCDPSTRGKISEFVVLNY